MNPGRNYRIGELAMVVSMQGFTDKEKEIINCICEKKFKDREIAKELFISKGTVRTHLLNIYSKLSVESKIDLVYELFSNNIIEIDFKKEFKRG